MPWQRLGVFAFLTSVAVAASVPAARADELRGVNAGAICNGFRHEGELIEEVCEVSVWDVWPEPRIAPTGTVTINQSAVCQLAPTDSERSVCTYTTMAPIGREFTIVLEYSGDPMHMSTWTRGGWIYPPGDFSWAGAAPVPSPYPSYAVAPAPPMSHGKRPRSRITHALAKQTRKHLASFRFAGGSGFECALDRGGFHPSAASFSHHVSAGRHVLRLRLQGGDGVIATFRWRVLTRRH